MLHTVRIHVIIQVYMFDTLLIQEYMFDTVRIHVNIEQYTFDTVTIHVIVQEYMFDTVTIHVIIQTYGRGLCFMTFGADRRRFQLLVIRITV